MCRHTHHLTRSRAHVRQHTHCALTDQPDMQNAFFVLLYFGVVIAVYVPTVDQWDGVKTNPILDAMCALALNACFVSLFLHQSPAST